MGAWTELHTGGKEETMRTAAADQATSPSLTMATATANVAAILNLYGTIAGIIRHTFDIKSNLILISNPIMAYAYQKQRKT